MRRGRARKSSEKCLTKNCANRQQENREHKFHPSRRHGEGLGRGGEVSWSCARNASDNFFAAFGFMPSAVVSRSSVSRSQTGPQITRIATNLEKRNLQCVGSTGCQPVVSGSLPETCTQRLFAACTMHLGKLPRWTGWQPVVPQQLAITRAPCRRLCGYRS